MNTDVTGQATAEMSPLFKARMGGACWLMTIVTSSFGMMMGGKLIVPGDAAATANNLLVHEALFRSGTAGVLMSALFYIGETLFVYEVLKPVSRSVSLLAAFFALVGCSAGALGSLFDLAPFVILNGGQSLSVFTVEQFNDGTSKPR
jgi:Domain of unknown function (DUF4386)